MAPIIGFFEQFKGADTVLLSITTEEGRDLAARLQDFAASNAVAMEIDARSVPGHETRLVAVREAQTARGRGEYRWLCGPAELGNIIDKLKSVINVAEGHQYFELVASKVQLMISVGEYRAKDV